jgi:hypothetical protein
MTCGKYVGVWWEAIPLKNCNGSGLDTRRILDMWNCNTIWLLVLKLQADSAPSALAASDQ